MVYHVVVMPRSLRRAEVKSELVDACSSYDIAPGDVFQVNVRLIATPDVPSDGNTSVGAEGPVDVPVPKLRTLDHALAPPPFAALTRQ